MWKNSLYNTLGGVIRLSLGLSSVPLLIRNLGVDKYGLYTAIAAILNIASFSEWPIATSITVYLSTNTFSDHLNNSPLEEKNNLSEASIYVATLALITTGLVYNSVPLLLFFFGNLNLVEKNILKEAVQIGSWIVCVRLTMQFFIGILQAKKTIWYH